MIRSYCYAIIMIMLCSMPVFSDNFNDLWYDGNAEISVYKLTENRYSEDRTGKRIMVFVTEPLSTETLIKPDSTLPDHKKNDVIKLNDIRKFNTGIYDYSVMTSVFSSVDPGKDIPFMTALKVSFTSQEWCGHVFEILKRKQDSYKGEIFSYFEKDGEGSFDLKIIGRTEPEDNIWLLVRELKEPLLDTGSTMTLNIIPSSWNRRRDHVKPEIYQATLKKTQSGRVKTEAGKFKTNLFQFTYNDKKTQIWVEQEYPHRIIKWIEGKNSTGILHRTIRTPYWKQHDNSDLKIRKMLKLTTE